MPVRLQDVQCLHVPPTTSQEIDSGQDAGGRLISKLAEHCVGLFVETEVLHQRHQRQKLLRSLFRVLLRHFVRISQPLHGGNRSRPIALGDSQPRLERDHPGRRWLPGDQGLQLRGSLRQITVADQFLHECR